jgi:Domain of unknown function (DUF4956)
MKESLKSFEPISGINYVNWVAGITILLIIAQLFSLFFNKYGTTASHRKLFSTLFSLFAISIYIIVTTIKTSLALSLGLVGALSILRFRTAIKEPEQIIYLLALTGVSISLAAEQFITTIVFATFFLGGVLFRHHALIQDVAIHTDYVVLDFQADELSIKTILDQILTYKFVTEITSIDNYLDNNYRIILQANYANSDVFDVKKDLREIDKSLIFNSFSLTTALK